MCTCWCTALPSYGWSVWRLSGWNRLAPGLKWTDLLLHRSVYAFSLPATSRELCTLHIFTQEDPPSWSHSILMYTSLVPCTTFTKELMREVAQGKEPSKAQILPKMPSNYWIRWISMIVISVNICSYLWKNILHIFDVINCTSGVDFQ